MDEPLNNHDARALIRDIVESGVVVFSGHALQRMSERGIGEVRIYNALRNGWVEGCDLIEGSWRYRLVARKLRVVVAFDSETKAIVISTWE